MVNINGFSWKVRGPAGFGIMSMGSIFSKIFSRRGYYVVDGKEYPSLIQGGHNVYTIRVSAEKIYSLLTPVNILVALDEMTIGLHLDEVITDGFVVYDSGNFLLAFQKSLEQEKIPLGIFYQVQKKTYSDGLDQIKDFPLVFQDINNINIRKLIDSYY